MKELFNGYKIRHRPRHHQKIAEGMKWCPVCGEIKPFSEFGKDKTRKHGVHSYCLICRASTMRDFRHTHTMTPEQKMKDNCRSYAHVYLKRGKLIKSELCQDCHKVPPQQMHHEDYSKPLNIVWLCKQCHRNRHHI